MPREPYQVKRNEVVPEITDAAIAEMNEILARINHNGIEVFRRYTAAMQRNIVMWMVTIPHGGLNRSTAKTLMEILEVTIKENHPEMLLNLAEQIKATPTTNDRQYVGGRVDKIYTLLEVENEKNRLTILGIRGLALLTLLRVLSVHFIPKLKEIATRHGATDLSYIAIYDTKTYVDRLLDALANEVSSNEDLDINTIRKHINISRYALIELMRKIFCA